jgi:hypothetical protein
MGKGAIETLFAGGAPHHQEWDEIKPRALFMYRYNSFEVWEKDTPRQQAPPRNRQKSRPAVNDICARKIVG